MKKFKKWIEMKQLKVGSPFYEKKTSDGKVG